MKRKVLLTMGYYGYDYEVIIKYLNEKGYDAYYKTMDTGEPDEVIQKAYGFDAIIAGGESWNENVLRTLSNTVKIVARYGAGFDKVDLVAAAKLGIAVTNTPGKMNEAVAEMALLLMMSAARRLCQFDRRIRNGEWWTTYLGTDLYGKTVGLIGFGNIAQRLARLLSGFSCNIIAYDEYFNENAAKTLSVKYSSFEDLVRSSDFISLHVPLTEKTKGMINEKAFSMMKSSAYIINTSRGAVIVEEDLIKALKSNRISGAGLDVYEQEPIPQNNPLKEMDNVVLMPHMAAATFESVKNAGFCAADNIIALFNGSIPPDILNPEYVNHIRA